MSGCRSNRPHAAGHQPDRADEREPDQRHSSVVRPRPMLRGRLVNHPQSKGFRAVAGLVAAGEKLVCFSAGGLAGPPPAAPYEPKGAEAGPEPPEVDLDRTPPPGAPPTPPPRLSP